MKGFIQNFEVFSSNAQDLLMKLHQTFVHLCHSLKNNISSQFGLKLLTMIPAWGIFIIQIIFEEIFLAVCCICILHLWTFCVSNTIRNIFCVWTGFSRIQVHNYIRNNVFRKCHLMRMRLYGQLFSTIVTLRLRVTFSTNQG